jgi:branched-subunit amino acid ABC-type transport system permease component
VIRWLYGRPLETLLATWGISLDADAGLVRTCSARRTCRWRTRLAVRRRGDVISNLTLPYNRIAILPSPRWCWPAWRC